MAKVSVCIPVYNVEKYISRCLDSIINQTYTDIEVIVVNDCTPDKSMDIIQTYAAHDSRIRIIEHTTNRGLMIARRTGYMAATGDYITFCDSDDTLSDFNALSDLVNAIENTAADIVAGEIFYINLSGSRTLWRQSLEYGNDKNGVYMSLLSNEFGHNLCGKLFKRALLQDYDYKVYEHFTNGEDGLLFYQLLQNVKSVHKVDTAVYNYYQNLQSATNKKMPYKALEGLMCFYDYVLNIPYENQLLKEKSIRYATYNVNEFALTQGYSRMKNAAKEYSEYPFISIGYRLKYMTLKQNLRWYIKFFIDKFKRYNFNYGVDYLLTAFSRLIPDKEYIRLKYYLSFHRGIDLNKPRTFNEKLNWLKLNRRNPMFTMMVDKYLVKQYVAKKIGEEYIVPCYGCWEEYKEIDWKLLPEKVFLKSTHDSSGGILVDKNAGINLGEIKKKFNRRTLKRKNWFWHLREWPYKDVKPRVLAEKYLDDGTGCELRDYKFYCFNGVPTYMYITNKGRYIYENFYDMNFTPVDISHGFERRFPEYEKPIEFEKMKELAAILSEDHPFIRIDFFDVKGKLYFGEYTFYDWGGMKPLNEKWEKALGEMIKLQ